MDIFKNYIIRSLLFLLIPAGFVHAQQGRFVFDQLSEENGVSNNSITCILKDSRGFIWIGTIDGLNLYNGYDFKVFKHNPSDSNSISDNFISTIIEDFAGNLWIGTQGGGLNKYDPNMEKFEIFLHDPNNENSICSNFIFHHKSLLLDKDTILWIGTDNGLCKLDLKTGKFEHHDLVCQTSAGNRVSDVRVIFEDNQNQLWIGTDVGLIRYHKETGKTSLYCKEKGRPGSISNNIITSIADDNDNKRLWIGTEEGLNLFCPEEKKFINLWHKKYHLNNQNSFTCYRIADPDPADRFLDGLS